MGRQMASMLPLSVADISWNQVHSFYSILVCSMNRLFNAIDIPNGILREFKSGQPSPLTQQCDLSLEFRGGTFTHVPHSEELNFWCAVNTAISIVFKRGNPSLDHLK